VADMSDLPPVSRVSTRRRVSVIWVIPLIAIAIGVWLAWDTLSKEGPTIEIAFETAEGLTAGQSLLKFKDIAFGTVKELRLSDDHTRVLVKIATTKQAEPLLNDKTIFWVVKPRLFAGSISGLDTLLSGSYVGMLPGKAGGTLATQFVGQEDPPVLQADIPGHTFLLKAARLGSISLGSPVFFHDLNVGEVLGWDLADMAESVTLHVFVRAPFDAYVNDQTRFWDASGLSVKLSGTGVEVQMESLQALLFGGVAFDTSAERRQAAASAENHVFPMFQNREKANDASYTRTVGLVSYFPGSVRGLATGSEVTMHGLVVGHVTDVRLAYDAGRDDVVAPIHYEVQPERIVGIGRQVHPDVAATVDELVKRGLRAKLESASLITGQQVVALEFVADAPPATVKMEGANFVLPITESGGLESLEASATELLNKVNTMPFQQIGKNLNDLLQSAQQLAGDLDKESAPTLKRLPVIAADLQSVMTNANLAMVNANRLIQSADTGYGDDSKFHRDLDRLMVGANDVIHSIRSVADLLSRRPESLIKGRTDGGKE
jgi:paraquat-inducible protein B